MFDEVVEGGLRQLSDGSRRTIELIDIDGLSYAETACLLQVPTGTVMSRLHRARNRMRDHLAAAEPNQSSC